VGLDRARPAPADLPTVEPPYALASLPFADVTLDLTAGTGEETDNRRRASMLLAGDLLWMTAEGFVSIENETELADARLRLGRKDPLGRALGPLGATEFTLGDIFTRELPLVADNASALGLTVSSFPLQQATEFDRITLRGDLPAGFEVELYRNEVLLDFQAASPRGRYEFVDVPLLFGQNELRLVFIGPQGQRRERVERYFAGVGLVEPGHANYRLSAGRHEERLVPAEFDDRQDQAEGASRLLMELEYGLSDAFSIAAAAARVPVREDEERDYLSLGLRGQALGVFGRLDLARDLAGGWAAQATAQTRFDALNVVVQHARFFDYTSEEVLRSGPGRRPAAACASTMCGTSPPCPC
jgi:hypothetical protein